MAARAAHSAQRRGVSGKLTSPMMGVPDASTNSIRFLNYYAQFLQIGQSYRARWNDLVARKLVLVLVMYRSISFSWVKGWQICKGLVWARSHIIGRAFFGVTEETQGIGV